MISRPQTDLTALSGYLEGYDAGTHFGEYPYDPTPLPDGTQLCKIAGQLCYMSFGRKRSHNTDAQQYFTNIKASKHGSLLEHANYSLLFYGISRSVTHELVRHRAGVAISQASQRYISGRVLRFVERPEYQGDDMLHALFLQRIEHAAEEYTAITELLLGMQEEGTQILSADQRTDLRKKVQQAARSCLPNETEAPLVITGNARAWRHIIEIRASAHAEIEIRALAVRIFLCLFQVDPIIFGDYTLEELGDGTVGVKTDYQKV
jgi:thymidylate synthase (FAD)